MPEDRSLAIKLISFLWVMLITLIISLGVSIGGIGLLFYQTQTVEKALAVTPADVYDQLPRIYNQLTRINDRVVPLEDHDRRWSAFFAANPGLVDPYAITSTPPRED